MLNSEQKKQFVLIASIGCDRWIATRYVGVTLEALRAALDADPTFAAELVRAEAQAELAHVKNIQQASRDERNWRASVWWLERRCADRYAPRPTDALAPAELKRLVAAVEVALADEIADPADRTRVLARLTRIADEIEHALRGPLAEAPPLEAAEPGGEP